MQPFLVDHLQSGDFVCPGLSQVGCGFSDYSFTPEDSNWATTKAGRLEPRFDHCQVSKLLISSEADSMIACLLLSPSTLVKVTCYILKHTKV